MLLGNTLLILENEGVHSLKNNMNVSPMLGSIISSVFFMVILPEVSR